jgi:hypothetical protein
MLEFLMQGLLFLLSAFIILTIISLVRVGLEALREWNENR